MSREAARALLDLVRAGTGRHIPPSLITAALLALGDLPPGVPWQAVVARGDR